jgi:hypothetical protein
VLENKTKLKIFFLLGLAGLVAYGILTFKTQLKFISRDKRQESRSSDVLTSVPEPENSPIISPEVQIAIIDTEYQSTSSLPPLFSVTIPAGSKYHQEREALFVENNDLTVSICSTCQLFIPGCGGLADGDPKEGGCEIETLTLGEGIDIGMHYQPTEPNKVLGYFDNYENSDGDNISIRVTTSDFRELTESDKLFLNKIISSLR